MLTLGYAKRMLAPFCGDGLCYNDDKGPDGRNRVTMKINEAVDALMKKPGCPQLTQCVQMCMENGCFTAGRDIEKIIKARIDGQYANVFDRFYEFLEAGPGMVNNKHAASGYKDLVDRGLVATQYDPPRPMVLGVCSDSPEVKDCRMLIHGWDETNREVRSDTMTETIFGEYLPITKDAIFYTKAKFSKVKSIIKPRTNGYVALSAFDLDTVTGLPDPTTRRHLAWYHPDDERPSFRRYAFKDDTDCRCHHRDKYYKLNAIVQLKFVELSRDTDLIWPENLRLLKLMLQALKYYDKGQPDEGSAYEKLAENCMLEYAAKYETVQAIPDIQVQGWNDACPVTP